MSQNPWTVTLSKLYRHAEDRATSCRRVSYVLAGLTILCIGLAVWFAFFAAPDSDFAVEWAIARLAAFVLLAIFLLLAWRIAWNYSNVWLGRAGTLEDLILALRLIGKDPAETEWETPKSKKDDEKSADWERDKKIARLISHPLLTKDEADLLQVVVRSIGRLRRTFEGDLLKDTALDQAGVKLGSH